MQTRIGIITQARMTSTRLPGKILKEVNGSSLLHYHTQRLKQSGIETIIATTINKTDDAVQEFAEKSQIKFYRGDENNVLKRYHETAQKYNLDVIVRVTSDCPLVDPHLIRNSIEKYLQLNNNKLYMSNVLERTFARGFDFEIFSFHLLHQAFINAREETDQEHVTPYIWKNKSGETEFYTIKQSNNNSHLRITVDTPDDFELVKQLITNYHAHELSYVEIENLLNNHPELTLLNGHIEQKKN